MNWFKLRNPPQSYFVRTVSFQDSAVSLLSWQKISLPLGPFTSSFAGKTLTLTPVITGLRSDRPLITSLGHIYRGPEQGMDATASLKKGNLPATFDLAQNYPNPFNPSTTLRFALPEAARVSLVIYDILGREVALLVNNVYGPGYHDVVWHSRTSHGATVASGVYFARLEVQSASGARVFTKTTKLLLTR